MTVTELENWFAAAPKPQMPIYLNPATKVMDYDQFISSHFTPLKLNPDSKLNTPLIIRLEQMKLLIESNL